MKRGAPTHDKMKDLADAICERINGPDDEVLSSGQCLIMAVGTMERLWHFVAGQENIRNGDLSQLKRPGVSIARATGWPRRDEEWLLETLQDCGWIDHDTLYVHDWHDHADNTTQMYLMRKGQTFANGLPPFWKRSGQTAAEGELQQCGDNVVTESQQSPNNVSTELPHGGEESQQCGDRVSTESQQSPNNVSTELPHGGEMSQQSGNNVVTLLDTPMPTSKSMSKTEPTSTAVEERCQPDLSSEQAGAPAPEPPPPPPDRHEKLRFQTKFDTTWECPEKGLEALQEAFPEIDVPEELKKAVTAAKTDKTQRRTAQQMPGRCRKWLEQARQRGDFVPSNAPRRMSKEEVLRDFGANLDQLRNVRAWGLVEELDCAAEMRDSYGIVEGGLFVRVDDWTACDEAHDWPGNFYGSLAIDGSTMLFFCRKDNTYGIEQIERGLFGMRNRETDAVEA